MKFKRLFIYLSVIGILGLGSFFLLNNVFSLIRVFHQTSLKIAGFESNQMEHEDATIHYYKGGDGSKKVLLIHGFGMGGVPTWYDAMMGLKNDAEILVPDLMWFGQSSGSLEPTLDNQARKVMELCSALDFTPDVIVGISYGGFVSLEILSQNAHLETDLVIVNSPGFIFTKNDVDLMCKRAGAQSAESLFVPDRVSELGSLLKFVTSGGMPDVPDFILDQMFQKETLKYATEKRKLMHDLVYNADAYRNTMSLHYNDANIIWSRNDSVFPLRYGLQLADALDAPIFTLDNSGHIPMPSDKEIYIEKLRELIVK